MTYDFAILIDPMQEYFAQKFEEDLVKIENSEKFLSKITKTKQEGIYESVYITITSLNVSKDDLGKFVDFCYAIYESFGNVVATQINAKGIFTNASSSFVVLQKQSGVDDIENKAWFLMKKNLFEKDPNFLCILDNMFGYQAMRKLTLDCHLDGIAIY